MDKKQAGLIGSLYAASAAILFMEAEKKEVKKKRKPRKWIKEWRTSREHSSSFTFLMGELRLNDKDAYRRYLRMDEKSFLIVLGYIRSAIEKKDTVLRNCISPEETLAAVLRFLATGESYRSLEFQSKLSLSFLSETVPKVCQIIYDNMKADYLKVSWINSQNI